MNDLKILILAAGKGTRLADKEHPSPKVLRKACGKPMLEYVLDSTELLGIDRRNITIIAGYMHEDVEAAFADSGCSFALQDDKAYGTGYAVICGAKQAKLDDFDGTVMILQGDVPLVRSTTIKSMYEKHIADGNSCTMLSCVSDLPLPFGRIVRGADGKVTAIVEDKDCTPEQKLIRELNVALYVFDSKKLCAALKKITTNNSAGEYYLTDVPHILLDAGEKIDAYITYDQTELWGINTQEDLLAVEKILSKR